jgi:hypothetical protein
MPTVDQVQVTRPATTGADGELARRMRFDTRREGRDLLGQDMYPLDLALAPDRVAQPVQAVAENAISPFDADRGESFCKLIGGGFCHAKVLLAWMTRQEV